MRARAGFLRPGQFGLQLGDSCRGLLERFGVFVGQLARGLRAFEAGQRGLQVVQGQLLVAGDDVGLRLQRVDAGTDRIRIESFGSNDIGGRLRMRRRKSQQHGGAKAKRTPADSCCRD